MTTESKAEELQARLAALAKETADVQAQLKDLHLNRIWVGIWIVFGAELVSIWIGSSPDLNWVPNWIRE